MLSWIKLLQRGYHKNSLRPLLDKPGCEASTQGSKTSEPTNIVRHRVSFLFVRFC
jgi:hypothetical protein